MNIKVIVPFKDFTMVVKALSDAGFSGRVDYFVKGTKDKNAWCIYKKHKWTIFNQNKIGG